MHALTFAAVLPALLVAHNVGDHWAQQHQWAATKGQRNRAGQLACAKHVAVYTLITAGVVGLLWRLLDLHITPLGFAVGQLVSAVTHYWADRRYTLAWLVELRGITAFYVMGQPRGHTVQVDRFRRDELPVGHTLSLDTDSVPLDNPTLGTGAYALDQAFHWLWLFVAALLTALI